MKILLLSRSRVVRELVRLALGEIKASLESAESLQKVERDRYDVLLLDDTVYTEDLVGQIGDMLLFKRRILLGNGEKHDAGYFDAMISKPFLPNDVVRILRGQNAISEKSESPGRKGEEERSPRVLDMEEIDEIRRLLRDDYSPDQDIAGEEIQTEIRMDPERLISLFDAGKMKKLKKLLQGAEITLTINFPGGGK